MYIYIFTCSNITTSGDGGDICDIYNRYVLA